MAFWNRKKEERATGEVEFENNLLRSLLNGDPPSRETALQIPTVAGGIDLIASIIASTPIKLYREQDGETYEVNARDDARIKILNDETGDTLNANEFWHAIVRDYYLGKGGYAYIHKERGQIKSLHYVEDNKISVLKSTDPIFKHYKILVEGVEYWPFEFLKILRNTRDGMQGVSIVEENKQLIGVAYESMLLEKNIVRRGGNRKGFLKTEKRIDEPSMEKLRNAFTNLYSNDSDNMVVLNAGIDFKEASQTSVEMQMSENKKANAEEFAKLFHVPADAIAGKAGAADIAAIAKLAAIPLMTTIQCELNRDFLLEREKGSFYWAFDTKELLKGDMKERFEAYQTALDANFMQIDEVRFAEDLKPLGLSWIKIGLDDVLYDPKTKTVYTPNTNQTSAIGESAADLSAGGGEKDES